MGSLVTGSVAQLLTFAILARGLGVGQFGVLMGLTALTNLAVQVCGLGATETMVRRVAQDHAIYPTALGHNLILTALSGLGLVIAFTAATPFFYRLSPDPLTNVATLFLLAVSNVVVVRWILLTEQIYIAHGRIRNANVANVGYALARTAAAALACLVFGVDRVATWTLWQGGCNLLVALACTAALRPLGRPRWTVLREEVRLGVLFSTPFIFQALRQNADFVVLGLVTSPEALGSYSMARRIVDTSALTGAALYRLSYPVLARATRAGLRAALPLVGGVLAASLAIAVATAAAVWVVAPFTPWLFGRGFGAMVTDLRVLCWIVVPVTIQNVAAETLGASARHAIRATLFNAGSLVGAGLTALLTSVYLVPGTMAALYAVEAAVALAFWTVIVRLVQREPPATITPRPAPG